MQSNILMDLPVLPGLDRKIGGNILKLVMVVNRIYFGTRLILLSLIF